MLGKYFGYFVSNVSAPTNKSMLHFKPSSETSTGCITSRMQPSVNDMHDMFDAHAYQCKVHFSYDSTAAQTHR